MLESVGRPCALRWWKALKTKRRFSVGRRRSPAPDFFLRTGSPSSPSCTQLKRSPYPVSGRVNLATRFARTIKRHGTSGFAQLEKGPCSTGGSGKSHEMSAFTQLKKGPPPFRRPLKITWNLRLHPAKIYASGGRVKFEKF